ncbi:molybdopterin cofactor-binding domain-containing protein [Aliikangiella coralliicola]|uniref:Molybdopterin-dependent oxidoreductase n=1 Tax=Aliikangiella coralliicola TaxID=2592383 RepID=A0A545UET0_9GAMM|nr:molybdopterin cofactor-binding domain-containing protein [Aliikangiella coralliicola]TQV87979.1 molybdopterin-dependent oxidoreductase [Aliikangiella coralliicola]
MSDDVSFFLNGELINVKSPPPDLLLIDFLRSPDISLSGAKKGCGQGGCGACTVILSNWNDKTNQVEHRSINSCLRAVCSLQGLVITTVEGTSGVKRLPPEYPKHVLAPTRGGTPFNLRDSKEIKLSEKAAQKLRKSAIDTKGQDKAVKKFCFDKSINPVAYKLAVNNGTQCGYCSTGFVMNMSAFLVNNPKPTKKQIEEAFDGNICRCTGYRPILTAMKTFAVDWSKEDEKHRMKCLTDDQVDAQCVGTEVEIPFPKAAKRNTEGVNLHGEQQIWLTPDNICELLGIYQKYSFDDIYLIHANTSFGVYTQDFLETKVLVNISRIRELYGIESNDNWLKVGAGTTYTDFLEYLDKFIKKRDLSQTTAAGALQFMAHRTAGTIVRNAASLAGNSMLVLKHIKKGTGEPFPSDLFTVLSALNASIRYVNLENGDTKEKTVELLIEAVRKDQKLASQILLLSYDIPLDDKDEVILAQKVALRDINAHSIVNSTSRLKLSSDLKVESVNLTFGAIAPFPWRARKTEEIIIGRKLSLKNYSKVGEVLAKEVAETLEEWAPRMRGVEYEGFSDQYRVELAVGFVYKLYVTALLQKDEKSVPPAVRSAGEITWGNWPVSDGRQYYKNQAYKAPVSQPYIKLMALYQTSGQVRYTHEMEVPPTAVNASFVQSERALANYCFRNPDTKEHPISARKLSALLTKKFPEFTRLITYKDVPTGGLNYQGIGGDQPIFAEKIVSYVGQSIALAVAKEETEANLIAEFITEHCIHYEPVDWPKAWREPVLGLDDAIARGSIFPDGPKSASYVTHIWKIIRHNSDLSWTKNKKPLDKSIERRTADVDGVSCVVVENTQASGGQVHFYMETQSCVAMPNEAERLTFHPSSQSPMGMHQTAASVLGVEHNQVEIAVRQLGGGYGGKTEPAKFVIGASAVAAKTMQKPVRLVMPRDNDTSMIGKRHPYYGQYQIAIDSGETNPENKGIIRGMDFNFYGDGGAFYDCSFIVSNCLQLRVDNAYMVENFQSTLDVCRTNTAPNTAMRSFGDIQGKIITENAIDDAAFSIGMDPNDVREKNLYQRGDVTPFGQALSYCYIREVWQYLKQVSEIDSRKKEIEKFNKLNKWKKRGIYMIPVKYGSGYNLVQLEQASALISVYSGDGSIIINQGGVDMGQGMVTKIEQIAAYILNVPMDLIQIQFAKTDVIPNPTSTGGSTGTAYNGLAVKQTCERLRGRLLEFGHMMLKEKGDQWCRENGVDFWNYGEKGWAAKASTGNNIIWQNLVALAYRERVSLVESFNARVPGGTTGVPAMIFKPESEQKPIPGIELAGQPIGGEVDSFCGFTYSAACSEVEVDILTGEVKIIRSDLMYDMGWSLNPALDIGQVEGAFIQGVGYVMTEKLVFEPDGDEKGRLNTVNTWRYKPPATTNIPLELNVHLFPRDKAANVPENPNDLLSAKEVGEPPLVLAASVFLAIKAAVRASRVERGLDGIFKMDAPATVQEVSKACAVDLSEK